MNQFISVLKQLSANPDKTILEQTYPLYKTKSLKTYLLSVFNSVVSAANVRTDAPSRYWIEIFKLIDKIIRNYYSNDNSYVTAISDFRGVIKTRFGQKSEFYKSMVALTGLSREETIQRNARYNEQVDEKNLNRRDMPVIFDTEIYDVMNKCLYSNDRFDKVLLVILATASRTIEAFDISTYSQGNKGPNYIKIEGLAKERNDDVTTIERPLIKLDAETLINIVNAYRNELDLEGINNQIGNRYNHLLNERVRYYFPGKGITAHKCRYIAANLAYLLYGKNSVENTWIQKYLGHKSGQTTKTYQSINVQLAAAPLPSNLNEVKTAIAELKASAIVNEQEHKEIKNDIQVVQNKPNHIFTEFINVNTKNNREFKMDKLTKLARALRDNGIKMSQSLLKKEYHYGGSTVGEFYKRLKNKDIIL